MSATMDFSPLKMETPSAHSSPHRTPMKPSPMCSPHVEPLEPSSYTNVGFSRGAGGFCGTGGRPLYPVVRDELDANTEKSSPRLPSSSPQTPSLASDLSRAYSPVIANFLTEDADGSSAGNPITATRSSPFPDQAKFPDNQKTHGYADRCRDVTEISDHVSTAPRDHTGAESVQRSPKNQSGVCDEEDEVDCDDNVVEIKDDDDESESEKDDEQAEEEEDEDQIECAECGTVFSNLQLYMDHTCYRSHVSAKGLTDHVTAKGLTETTSRHQQRPHPFLHNESPISDAEIFKGKIVYNPNGSAYIIEGSSLDSDLDLPLLPDSIIVKEGQSVLSVERSIPKIANAVFFSKPDAVHGSSRAPCDPELANKSSPAMHSYNVYDLRHSEIDDLLQRFPACKSQRHHVKPILMCFICKLSFGNPKSFLRHCMYDHAMSLHEDEKTLLCRPTASALIHTYGKEKQPTISVLQPIPGFESRASELRKDQFFSTAPESMKPTNNNNFLDSRKPSMEERNSCPPHVRDSKTPKENSPGVELQDPEHKEDSGIFQRSSAHPGAHHSHKMDNFLTTSQVSGSEFLPSNHFLYTSQGSVMDQPSMRQRSSPSVLPSPQGNSGSPSGSDSFYQSSSTPASSLPNLLLPSSTSAGMHFAMSSTSNALQSLGLNMPSFFGSCDEHPQGRAQGVECPKCDMVLSSSQSLGGHMTMTHSRNSCKTLKCPKCNWHYKYQETLEIHMKEKHPDSDAQCVYCLTNQSHPRLARGESYSCGYKPYRCEVCNYSTTTKGNLSIHMQSDKHINNMQDLANGGTEMKMQPPPSPAPQTLPPTASTPAPHNSSPYPQEESQYKKLKQKQSFRCDVCSYETSVARNLRIHMTSEKHTHNMLVMSQSISHLHQDMTLHQINQMNKLLALNQQEQAARFAALSPHLPGNMFSYEQTAMLLSASANPAPSGNYEIPMNLTKENGIDDSLGHISNKDATKMFQCCICNKYGSDSVENVHNHIQYDRTKAVPADAHVTFSNGAYHCNLCTYKTHLKANFQLHCKTDKHLQKLQLVNHIQEGGAENEWRLTVSGSPMQISCNACSFFANSTHKMQLHLSTLQHESCAQLFRHLQLLDHATPASPPGKLRYYHCTLCVTNVHTKQRLILHSRSPHHVRKEQALPQGRLSIFDVFLIKEISEGANVEFEDAESDPTRQGFLHHMKVDDDTAERTCEDVSREVSSKSLPPPAHISTTAASRSLSSSSATDYSVFRHDPLGKGSNPRENAANERCADTLGICRSLVLNNRSSPLTAGSPELNSDCPSSGQPLDITRQSGEDYRASHGSSSGHHQVTPPPARTTKAPETPCILCPLCRHECAGTKPLEEHLVKEHNVAPEGIQRLMSMVEMPASPAHGAAPTPIAADSTDAHSHKDPPARESKHNPEHDKGGHSFNGGATSYHQNNNNKLDSRDSLNPTTPSPSQPSPSPAVTSSSGKSSNRTETQGYTGAFIFGYDSRQMAPIDETKEIDLEHLDAEHAGLLAKEGLDLAAQEKLDKEFEDLFRCQTCNQTFSNIDKLYCHQNELGHLELKQTPKGPGYLCWKKGCNQYFKTAVALQVHFREIHAKKSLAGTLSAQELEAYKFKCGQCSYCFKSLEVMQRHTLIHLLQSVTHCRICSRKLSSIAKMRQHLEVTHGDMSLADMTIQMEGIEANAALLFSSPAFEQFTSKMLMVNGNSQSKPSYFCNEEESVQGKLTNGLDMKENIERNDDEMDEGDGMTDHYREKHFFEDYMNSQSMAEEHYRDVNRKFKCTKCRVAFTNQRYLLSHNKTSQHRQLELTERFDDPSRPYRCELCKESFTQKNILMVHYNSVSHLHRMKQHNQLNGENLFNTSLSTPPPLSPSPNVNSPSGMAQSNGGYETGMESSNSKPYKCNICKVSYNNQPSIEIHLRSVGHKTKASKLGELIHSGQVDVHQALIEHPDPRSAGKQQAQIIADLIHQQATAQAASNASYFNNLQGMQGLNTMAQLSLLQGLSPTTSHMLNTAAQNALVAMSNAQLEAYYPSLASQFKLNLGENSRGENSKLSNSTKEKLMRASQSHEPEKIVNMIIKQDGKIEPANADGKSKLNFADKFSFDPKNPKKDEELPPNFPHAPIIARPRGFMGRFKPQLHRSLLENFGFECVMHYNEEHSAGNTKAPEKDETLTSDEKEVTKEKDEETEKMEVDEKVEVEESVGNQEKCSESETEEKRDENKENLDLPELGKCRCGTCNKDFSNVWVLKNHEEEIHNHFVSPDFIENFGKKFKEDWEKNLPKVSEHDSYGSLPSSSPTPTNISEKMIEMPPPPPPSQPQLPANFDMSQLLPLMSLNMLPMHLPLNLVGLGLQNSLIPSLMMPTLDLSQTYLPQMQTQSMVDSASNVTTQQQLQAAAAAAQQAQNQKRVRTRISDDQLKVLRQYFDINNSPSEEQINKMSDQTGLPQKVIKHWFRNTLFKERQRNKDSPYNFNNPPSTSIDLDEYDRTGKIPEVKLEPEEEEEPAASTVQDVKKENTVVKVENGAEKEDEHEQGVLDNPPLKIDLAPKNELCDESRKEQESHSNTSSPSNMSSIPSTPTASAPATPTPILTANSINAANSLAFSLESYAANIARLEAATFQSMGKRANRTRFTDYQIKTLQDYFERNAYPKDDELEHLSKILGLSARVIVVWFQNARQKARKIYENQPPAENPKEVTSPFQRTPGLNYQCKKCNSVFQRYYELIKHQKNSCVGESNNNKPMHNMIEDDSNFSYSNDDSNFSDRQSTPSSAIRERDYFPRSQPQEPMTASSTATVKLPSTSQSSTSSSQSLATSTTPVLPTFKCDKCTVTFSRFDAWQDHQKAHSIAPAMFTPFSSSSAFGMLQNLAHQDDKALTSMAGMSTPNSLLPSAVSAPISASQPSSSMATTPTSSSTSPSPSSKRKTDSEDESGEQPRDKRLRTTILPEQLDYLYQQYQVDCNPSRKQLEHIASTVNLKKRVVQVWFQNTRARERKGHYRAHQQLINKRCPFCRALFRAKSALESHLATKHPEEMAKGDINIDLIPDAMIEPPSSHSLGSLSGSSNHGSDISKLLPPGSATTMPNYMAFMSSAGALNLQFPSPTPDLLGHPSFEDPFFKKYMSELASNMSGGRQDHSGHIPTHHTPTPSNPPHTPKSSNHPPSASFPSTARPLDAHKPKSTPQLPVLPPSEDAPLDLSKPVRPSASATSHSESTSRLSIASSQDFNERAMEMEYLRRLNSLDDSFSETQSEMADNDYMNEMGGSPPSPSHTSNGSLNHSGNTPGSSGKRYRTQMSATQVKVMKHLFQDYKTPTMAECELLGHEIGLAKRVVQVWFQNARAKEKKAKLNSGKPLCGDMDFPKSPEECKLCNYKYTHKVTVQDHIFTKTHIDRVKNFLHSESDRDLDMSGSSLAGLSRTPGDSSMKSVEKPESARKEKKGEASMSKEEQQQQVQAAMEMAMNAQMMSALGGYMPGIDPASYLTYMYAGLPGYFPGMGLSIVQPGLMPGAEHMMAYDPLAYGTPLPLLQIPAAAIKSVSEKLAESGAVLARYTQDCQALADLHSVVTSADLTVAAEATLDVGYICKKCQMVYPARESCVVHQRTVCLGNAAALPKGYEPIMKLEQIQYECRACNEKFSTILEFKGHCQQDSHKTRLMKYKAKEAARREAAGSPSSSAPYTSGKPISPSFSSKPMTTSPSNNNNNVSHNNNRIDTPSPAHSSKPVVPSPAHQYKIAPTSSSPSVYRDKPLPHSPGFSEMVDMKRLKAE